MAKANKQARTKKAKQTAAKPRLPVIEVPPNAKVEVNQFGNGRVIMPNAELGWVHACPVVKFRPDYNQHILSSMSEDGYRFDITYQHRPDESVWLMLSYGNGVLASAAIFDHFGNNVVPKAQFDAGDVAELSRSEYEACLVLLWWYNIFAFTDAELDTLLVRQFIAFCDGAKERRAQGIKTTFKLLLEAVPAALSVK